MKVKDLIKNLQKQNPESTVLTYIEEAEEYGNTEEVVTIQNKDNMPYAKGDIPEFRNEVVLIKGWIAT